MLDILNSVDSGTLLLVQELIDIKIDRKASAIAFENNTHVFKNTKLLITDIVSVLESRYVKFIQEVNKIKFISS